MKTIKRKLKVLFDFLRLPDGDAFISRLTAIHDAMSGNAAFPNPPVELAVFKTAISDYAAAVVVALDGSKQAIANRKKLREVVVKMAEQLGHYVEGASPDEAIFTSSGFKIRSTTVVPPQPTALPTIDHVDQGKTGELLVVVKAVQKARIYQVRYGQLGAAGAAPTTFDIVTVARVRKPVPIMNLTPGTTYVFQVRAFGTLGFTDWSNPVQRMCI